MNRNLLLCLALSLYCFPLLSVSADEEPLFGIYAEYGEEDFYEGVAAGSLDRGLRLYSILEGKGKIDAVRSFSKEMFRYWYECMKLKSIARSMGFERMMSHIWHSYKSGEMPEPEVEVALSDPLSKLELGESALLDLHPFKFKTVGEYKKAISEYKAFLEELYKSQYGDAREKPRK